MISNLVSSILNPSATAGAAEKAVAHQMDDDKTRPNPAAVFAAKPVSSQLERVSVNQSGTLERIDYYHTAKKMIRDAFADLAGGVQSSFGEIGLDDGMAEKFTMAMLRQTKNALLWGVGFSVKLMTATVSQTSENTDGDAKPSFNIMARSIEISVNHSDGLINVSAGSVSIESQFAGGLPAPHPHILDIRDSDGQSTGNLTTALQALRDPQSLFLEEVGEEEAGTFRLDTVVPFDEQAALAETLPRVDTPRVLSRPDFNSRILMSEMDHFRNERNELVTYMRLDALVPLTDKPAVTVASPPTHLADAQV